MRFDDRFLDEIKSRLRLSDVIGKTVKLRRQGREYVGLSPFNKERSPSFFVNDDKGFYHDFSSGKHGDLISFLQETERLSFIEAVERLAGEAGVALPAPDPKAAAQDKRRQSLSDWLDTAAAWFEAELRRPAGAAARDYLERRGLSESDWSRFRLGFSPPGRIALKDYLIAKGALPRDLTAAGLTITPEDGGEGYDRFRDRIIFPITDARGRLVSFGGRAMDPKARAKYLNGPDTDLFDKGQVLYGQPEARRLLHAGGDGAALVVVEGYMDVIACQRADIAAVAAMGTALTEAQMEILWRMHPEPTLCFDGDRPGMQAASRTIDRSLPNLKPGKSFRFATVTGGKDPDDILREQGADALRSQLSETTPFVNALFSRECSSSGIETPEQRADLKGRLRRLASTIADKDLSEEYRGALFDLFYEFFKKRRFDKFDSPGSVAHSIGRYLSKNPSQTIKERILAMNAAVAVAAIEHPDWLYPYVEQFERVGFGDHRLRPLVQSLMEALYDPPVSSGLVMRHVQADGHKSVLDLAYKFAREVPTFPFVEYKKDEEHLRLVWCKCFEKIIELSSVEDELEERRELYRRRDPGVVTGYYLERGRELQKYKLNVRVQISSGILWAGRELGDDEWVSDPESHAA